MCVLFTEKIDNQIMRQFSMILFGLKIKMILIYLRFYCSQLNYYTFPISINILGHSTSERCFK